MGCRPGRDYEVSEQCRATHRSPEGRGAPALKAWRNSAPTLAERQCQPRPRAVESPPTLPCRAPLPLPRPRPPGRSPTLAYATFCTCLWASALSRPRSCVFTRWRPRWVPHPSLRLGSGRVSGEQLMVSSDKCDGHLFPQPHPNLLWLPSDSTDLEPPIVPGAHT